MSKSGGYMLFRLFKKKKPIAIETTPTGSELLANDYIPDQNEIRAAALVGNIVVC